MDLNYKEIERSLKYSFGEQAPSDCIEFESYQTLERAKEISDMLNEKFNGILILTLLVLTVGF